jgi:hypothetical protein
MTQKTRAQLFQDANNPFRDGNIPTNADYQDLGDSFFALLEDTTEDIGIDDTTDALWQTDYADYEDLPEIAATGRKKISGLINALLVNFNNFVSEQGDIYSNLANTSDLSLGAELIGRAIQVVNDVATLRTIAPNSSRKIYLSYHTSVGDGGHGMFRPVTGAGPGTYTDNGGTIIVPSGGDGSAAWLREFAGPMNVQWFGAHKPGTNVTTEIQNTLNTGFKHIYAPPDTYLITFIELSEGQHLFGAGMYGGTIFKLPDNYSGVENGEFLGVGAKTGIIACQMSNFEYDGNEANNRAWVGLGKTNADMEAHGINFGQDVFNAPPARVAPLFVTLENIYSHDCVRNPLLCGNDSVVIGNNIHLKNSVSDHLIYSQFSKKTTITNLLLEGFANDAPIASENDQFVNVQYKNFANNPTFATTGYETTRIIQDRVTAIGWGSQFKNVSVEIDPTYMDVVIDFRAPGITIDGLDIKQIDDGTETWSVLVPLGGGLNDGASFRNIVVRNASENMQLLNTAGTHTLSDAVLENVDINYRSGAGVVTTELFDIGAAVDGMKVKNLKAGAGCGKLILSTAAVTNTRFTDIDLDNNNATSVIQLSGSGLGSNKAVDIERLVCNGPVPTSSVQGEYRFSDCWFNANPTNEGGEITFSGDGVDTTFNITHNIGIQPGSYEIHPRSADAATNYYLTLSGTTQIIINFIAAPPSGTDNIKFEWRAKYTSPSVI